MIIRHLPGRKVPSLAIETIFFFFFSRACSNAALLFHAVECFNFVVIADTPHRTRLLTVVIKYLKNSSVTQS